MAISKSHLNELLEAVQAEGDPKLELAPLAKAPADVPPEWRDVLMAKDPTKAVWDLWKPMAKEFPKTLRIFKKSLQAVGLLTTKKRPPSLVYIVTEEKGKEVYAYRGFVPAPVKHPKAKLLPPEFPRFYEVHDGWVLLWGFSMGPLPVRDWRTLSDNPKSPASRFLVVFDNGGGAALGFDLEESPPLCYIVWSDDDPQIVPDVWREIDTWIAAQQDDLDPA